MEERSKAEAMYTTDLYFMAKCTTSTKKALPRQMADRHCIAF